MIKVLVTGGTGFVGRWVLKTQPSFVDAIYLSSREYKNSWWREMRWDYIVHLAPIDPVYVLNLAKRDNAKLLYCSSGAVYDINSEYASNKRRWECICIESDARVVIARPFSFYGEGLDDDKAISSFIKMAKSGSEIRITGNGLCTRSYMHGRSLGNWLWVILFRGECNQFYDIGSTNPITMLELARAVANKYNPKARIVIENGEDPVPYYVPKNMQKTYNIL